MGFLDKFFGDPNEKIIKSVQPSVDAINSLENEMKAKSGGELREMTEKFKQQISGDAGKQEAELEAILPEAFAVIREAARRNLGFRHYDVQLIGGIMLHQGRVAEMRTGEGKTLVATLPLYLNALTGRGAHLVTVNDYLSRVGAGWMAPVYYSLGLSTAVITHDSAHIYDPDFVDESQFDKRLSNFRAISRQEAYACDILYGTNNEFGFDYLRDNMVYDLDQAVQRELHFAIVDEVDSILIDEARTPLIISAPAEKSTEKYLKFAQLVTRLKENEDYNIDEKMRAATLSEGGITKMEKWLGVDNIYTTGGIREVHHIEQALKAHALFRRDRDYVVKNGEVVIVDEFTGRLMHGRRYSEGLHQAIEAKEGVQIQRESQTFATITFQNYFRLYDKLSGMTGTAMTEAEEFAKIYKLETVSIPTHKPMIRQDMNDLIYRTEEAKINAVIKDIKERSQKGQPVLVGTISIEKNEIIAAAMERQGLKPQMLNAKNHEKEAQIIADAGKPGAITLATNMAGRGVDINLGGGEPAFAAMPAFAKAPADRPAFAAMPAGRQEAPADRPAFAKTSAGKQKAGAGGDAEESEEHKAWAKEHKKVVALGGLHVIGTERHEARRIDNQLRGRAGRQGDPGSSQFYVSTEDDLIRIFSGDRMKNIMTTLRVPDDMPIENKIISKSIESAQRKVEGHNFDIRKHLVEYDDVINKHREAIYRKRKEVLVIAKKKLAGENSPAGEAGAENPEAGSGKPGEGDKIKNIKTDRDLTEIILGYVEKELEQVVSFHTASENIADWNLEEIYQVVSTIFPVTERIKEDLSGIADNPDKLDKVILRTKAIEHLSSLARKQYRFLRDKASESGMNWIVLEKSVLIRSIDTLWVEHLEAMSSVRQGIGLRGYGQRDPLMEYKKEAYRLYNELNNLIQKEVVYSIFKVASLNLSAASPNGFKAPTLSDLATQYSAPAKTADSSSSSFAGFKQAANSGSSTAGPAALKDNIQSKVKNAAGKKVGRNDLCPCGSGKKYKKCCGA